MWEGEFPFASSYWGSSQPGLQIAEDPSSSDLPCLGLLAEEGSGLSELVLDTFLTGAQQVLLEPCPAAPFLGQTHPSAFLVSSRWGSDDLNLQPYFSEACRLPAPLCVFCCSLSSASWESSVYCPRLSALVSASLSMVSFSGWGRRTWVCAPKARHSRRCSCGWGCWGGHGWTLLLEWGCLLPPGQELAHGQKWGAL